MKQNLYWRSLFFFTGIVLLSLGIALIIQGQTIGVGSWDVLHIGLAQTLGLTIGSWSILIGLFILAIDGIVRKRLPRIGTYLDMFLAGIFIDLFNWMLPTFDGLGPQISAYIAGLVLLGFGCGMYMVADLGVGPRDTLMLLIVQKFGWTFGRARTVMEVSVAIVGFVLGGPVGVGTVLMAFLLGPIVQWALGVNQRLYKYATGAESLILETN